jgi:hypothetical protein
MEQRKVYGVLSTLIKGMNCAGLVMKRTVLVIFWSKAFNTSRPGALKGLQSRFLKWE